MIELLLRIIVPGPQETILDGTRRDVLLDPLHVLLLTTCQQSPALK